MNNKLNKLEEECAQTERAISLVWSALIIGVLLLIVSIVGMMSKEDNDVSEKYYCQMVHEGVQPDYNGSYKQGKCPQSLEKQP